MKEAVLQQEVERLQCLLDHKSNLIDEKEKKVIMTNKQMQEEAKKVSILDCDIQLNSLVVKNLENQLVEIKCKNQSDREILREKESEL